MRIEHFPISFKAIAVDLMEGKQVVLDRGDLVTALRATTAFPGVFAPLMHNNQMLVDGGVLNNLPVEEMKKNYGGQVIAVDVAREHEKKPPRNMIEVVYRSYSLMTAERKHSSLKLADLVIRPGGTNLTKGEGAIRRSTCQRSCCCKKGLNDNNVLVKPLPGEA
ncbi:patatin-like phospholipase family protein [Cohnella thermotolerans]|uniref:patatin-like phospholipase family protein n=1 Tax=Cohnella thermotolerans TaxID=329858 RepID=UPI0006843F53|nr:patatin-like phospholipase family protein [Cohnella thermotolerans]